jgi:deazaflavin-dependent oxidoreductase (nitroreductase family)
VPSAYNDYNAKNIDEFRANGGRVADFGNSTLLLLHHTGAKSGEPRINPLAYLADGDRYVIFATKAGAPTNPAWYHNLKADPSVTIEVGNAAHDGVQERRVLASEATGAERDRLYAKQAQRSPAFAEYEHRTERRIPVMILTQAD